MILHLKGNNGSTIYEIDTNMIRNCPLPPTGDVPVYLRDGRVVVIDRDEYDKLHDAINAPR